MKKMLFTLAVMVAIVTQAASFKWTAANIYDSTGAAKFSGSATLYGYLTTAGASSATVVATADVVAGVVKDGSTVGKTFSGDFESGSKYSFYFVFEDAGKTFTSDAKEVAATAVGTPGIVFGSMADATKDTSKWSGGGDVPEPTSGLLLLVGGALLAIRRKRK